jgi:hypothetical protein
VIADCLYPYLWPTFKGKVCNQRIFDQPDAAGFLEYEQMRSQDLNLLKSPYKIVEPTTDLTVRGNLDVPLGDRNVCESKPASSAARPLRGGTSNTEVVAMQRQ